MHPRFIELHDLAERELISVNVENICAFAQFDHDGMATTSIGTNDGSLHVVSESYDEVKQMIKESGIHIQKADPRLDTKSPLTMEDLKDMIGEPVWNSNTRDWWLIHYCLTDPEEVIVYNKDGVQESWDEKDLIKKPLYRMKQGMMFISGDNIEVHE